MPENIDIDPRLKEFASTARQLEHLQAVLDAGSITQGAIVAGTSVSRIRETIKACKKRAEAKGYDPARDLTRPVGDSQLLAGASTLYGDDGQIKLQWVKSMPDKARQHEAFEKAVETLCENIEPFKPVPAPAHVADDLLTNYIITDFHLGMYAWHLETGDDWDMKIAQEVLLNAISDMMIQSPDSHTAVFSNIGDLMHWDGLLAVTPMNKHVLDADTRFDLLVESAINILEKAVEMLLHKHHHVHVIHAEGNHDPASSSWLRRVTKRAFRDNPRVSVETSPFPFYHYVWGITFLGWHHGHLQKMESLPLVFATDPKFREDFGRCKYAYVKTGHRHQKEVIEKGGVIVEQVETLAARDAYAARGFPYSQRGTTAVTFHKDRGEVSRCTVRPRIGEPDV